MKALFPQRTDDRDQDDVRRGTLLYVEDDPENANATRLRLESKYELLHAASDEEACELILRHGARLLAILMDIELKGSRLNGVELTKLFRGTSTLSPLPLYARDPDLRVQCPIVFVTAYGARYPSADLLAMGGNKVLEKPVDFGKLTLTLAQFQAGEVLAMPKRRG